MKNKALGKSGYNTAVAPWAQGKSKSQHLLLSVLPLHHY